MNREEKIKEFEAKAKEYFVLAKDLQRQLDELKAEPEYKEGWYKYTPEPKYLMYRANDFIYGFNVGGDWVDKKEVNFGINPYGEYELATPEEVEAALIKEAKRRGYKEGVRFKSAWSGAEKYADSFCMSTDDNFMNTGKLALFLDGDSIFYNGQWAEIITEPKVMVNDYEMEQDGDIIKFGCAKFNTNQIKGLDHQINAFNQTKAKWTNRKIKSITLDSGVEITVKQLKEIVDNIK